MQEWILKLILDYGYIIVLFLIMIENIFRRSPPRSYSDRGRVSDHP